MVREGVPSRLGPLLDQPGLVTCESSLQPSDEALYPEEAKQLEGCVEKRQREIAAGRRCARRALARLGIADFPVLAGPDRAPVWPETVVGSITHTDGCADGYCGVAVGDSRKFAGIGVDAEPRLPLPNELWSWILDESERQEALRAAEPGIYARLIFSAKETTYKTLYPMLKRILEFSDVHIHAEVADGLFFAGLTRIVGSQTDLPPSARLVGRLVMDDELIVTGMALPRDHFPLPQEGLSLGNVPC
jgi:4'-phosphopantetheinyl transferase EntD